MIAEAALIYAFVIAVAVMIGEALDRSDDWWGDE